MSMVGAMRVVCVGLGVGLALGLICALAPPAMADDPVAPSDSVPAPEQAADAARATDGSAPVGNEPRDHIEFSSGLTADCMLHHAQLRQIVNTDSERAIRVVLWNYTGKTRSQGSSTKILQPGAAPTPLGCDGTAGLKRRWVIESAEFVDVDSP